MYALRGKREYQEDCGLAVEMGELLIIGVADGFNKPTEAGSLVSKTVIREVMLAIGTQADDLQNAPGQFLKATFERIHEQTRSYVAGSTLSLAIINRNTHSLTLGTVGDSIVVVADPQDILSIHPLELLNQRHEGLSSAFGDCHNAKYRTFKPHIAEHELPEESILLISSDGLYPVTPENNIAAIEELAHTYIRRIRNGASPQELAQYASLDLSSPDNITVAIYKRERNE